MGAHLHQWPAQGRVHQLPRMNAFGGVPAALRFGDLLADALDA